MTYNAAQFKQMKGIIMLRTSISTGDTVKDSKDVTQTPDQVIVTLLEQLALHPELEKQTINMPKDWEPVTFPAHDKIKLADEIKYPDGIEINRNTAKIEHLINCIRRPLFHYFKQFVDKWQFTLPLPKPIQLCGKLLLIKPNLFNEKDCDFSNSLRDFQSKLMVEMILWIEKYKMDAQASLSIPQQLLDAGFNTEFWRSFHADNGGTITRLALSETDRTHSALRAWEKLSELDPASLALQNPEIFADADPEFLRDGGGMYLLRYQGPLILITLFRNMDNFTKLLLENGASLTKDEVFHAIPYISLESFTLLATLNQQLAPKFESPFSSDSIHKLIQIIIDNKRLDLLNKLFEVMKSGKLIDLLSQDKKLFTTLIEHIMTKADPNVLNIFLKHGLNPDYFVVTNIYTGEERSLLTFPMTFQNMQDSATRANMHKKISLLLEAHANPSLPHLDSDSYKGREVERNALEHFQHHCSNITKRNFSWFGLARANLTPEGKEYYEIKLELKDAMKIKR